MKIPGFDLDALTNDLTERGDKMQNSLDRIVELLEEQTALVRDDIKSRQYNIAVKRMGG